MRDEIELVDDSLSPRNDQFGETLSDEGFSSAGWALKYNVHLPLKSSKPTFDHFRQETGLLAEL